MATKTTNNELSEWPAILEGVDAWPKAKWPRRLEVPPLTESFIIKPKSSEAFYALPTYNVDEASGWIVGNTAYTGRIEHAGSGFLRLVYRSGVLCEPITKVELFKRVTPPQTEAAC